MTITTAAPTKATQVYRVYIKATPQAIWDAITKPDWSRRYGYGVSANYDLRPGGKFQSFSNEGMRELGTPEIAVDGEVLEADPPHKLVQTWRLCMDPALVAEGFTRLTYEIGPTKDGVTRLTVTHDLENAPRLSGLVGGELEEQGAGGGWAWVLSGLKTLLETGTGLNE
jgi:uncharacterized protein YndB with AHSA1/START domain